MRLFDQLKTVQLLICNQAQPASEPPTVDVVVERAHGAADRRKYVLRNVLSVGILQSPFMALGEDQRRIDIDEFAPRQIVLTILNFRQQAGVGCGPVLERLHHMSDILTRPHRKARRSDRLTSACRRATTTSPEFDRIAPSLPYESACGTAK